MLAKHATDSSSPSIHAPQHALGDRVEVFVENVWKIGTVVDHLPDVVIPSYRVKLANVAVSAAAQR